jgi:peptide/nickel transport system ATP-binding protein
VIPPERLDIDQAAYRRVMDLRDALERGELAADAVWDRIDADRGDEGAFVADVTETFLDDHVDALEGADRRVVEEAVSSLARGERADAVETLRERFESVCETQRPERGDASHATACHLVEDLSESRTEPN